MAIAIVNKVVYLSENLHWSGAKPALLVDCCEILTERGLLGRL